MGNQKIPKRGWKFNTCGSEALWCWRRKYRGYKKKNLEARAAEKQKVDKYASKQKKLVEDYARASVDQTKSVEERKKLRKLAKKEGKKYNEAVIDSKTLSENNMLKKAGKQAVAGALAGIGTAVATEIINKKCFRKGKSISTKKSLNGVRSMLCCMVWVV